MAHGVAMLMGAIKGFLFNVIIGPTTIGGATSNPFGSFGNSNLPRLFVMPDGNEVAVYFDGTNGGWRIKSSGTWGAFTNFGVNPAQSTKIVCASNGGSIIFVAHSNGTATAQVWLSRLSYSGGSITEATAAGYGGGGASANWPIGMYYDGTNNYFHVAYVDTGTPSASMNAYDLSTTITAKYSGTPTYVANQSGANCFVMVGDGTSTFFICQQSGTSLSIKRWVAGAASYSTANTAETGIPATLTSAVGVTACYDGTNIIFFVNDNATAIKYTTRTGVNTYSAFSTLATATLSGQDIGGVMVRTTGSAPRDMVYFYRRNNTQANGEIYYVRRLGGSWDASPGTLLAGGAATGWQWPSACATDLNTVGKARCVYSTGTASFILKEDGLQ